MAVILFRGYQRSDTSNEFPIEEVKIVEDPDGIVESRITTAVAYAICIRLLIIPLH